MSRVGLQGIPGKRGGRITRHEAPKPGNLLAPWLNDNVRGHTKMSAPQRSGHDLNEFLNLGTFSRD
jgi:hypothetical protein